MNETIENLSQYDFINDVSITPTLLLTHFLSRALFWHRDEEFFDDALQEKLLNAVEVLNRAEQKGQPDTDLHLVQQSIQQL